VLGSAAAPLRLAVAEVSPDQKVRYEEAPLEVRARVARSRRILLVIHGLFGDTLDLLTGVRRQVGGGKSIHDSYDLLLACDYENLNTPVSQTARALAEALKAAGLGPGHDKELHVLAHSLGGLVARWLVEREGGNQIVRRVVLAGTPNAGFHWPSLHALAVTGLTIGLNSLTGSVWPAAVFTALAGALGRHEVTLEEMKPGSVLLGELASSADPNVPYTVLAGTRSVPPSPPGRPGLLQRLGGWLGPSGVLGVAADQRFFGKANDVVVSVESIQSLPAGWKQAPVGGLVECDHMSYFHDPESVAAVAAALAGT
jgi:pimeloyl-ACP methyl ester carboxylesterase